MAGRISASAVLESRKPFEANLAPGNPLLIHPFEDFLVNLLGGPGMFVPLLVISLKAFLKPLSGHRVRARGVQHFIL